MHGTRSIRFDESIEIREIPRETTRPRSIISSASPRPSWEPNLTDVNHFFIPNSLQMNTISLFQTDVLEAKPSTLKGVVIGIVVGGILLIVIIIGIILGLVLSQKS